MRLRGLLLAGALCLLAVGLRGDAQVMFPDPPWCPTCYIEGTVDVPASPYARLPRGVGGVTVEYGQWFIGGWAFMCHTGKPADRIEVWYRASDGTAKVLKDAVVVFGLARPDVEAWAAAARPNCTPPPNAGYHVYMPTPIPKGTREIYVNVWYGWVMHGTYRVVTII